VIYLNKKNFIILSAVLLAFLTVTVITTITISSILKQRKMVPGTQSQSTESISKTGHIPSPENYDENNKALSSEGATDDIITETQPTAIYILKRHNDILGIFSPETGEIIRTLDVQFQSLPEFDREILERGIEIYSEEDLLMAIEDYIS
jgi:hypothetical protein